MRVLILLEASGGGAGRHVLDLSLGLAERGLEVHLAYSPLRLAEPFRSGLPRLREAGVRLLEVPMRRAPHPSDLKALFFLLRYARREGPFHLIHGHSSKGGALARLLGLLLGVPVLYTPHGVVTLSPFLKPSERLLYGLMERLMAPLTRLAIAVSPWEAEALKALGYRRVEVVPNGVDLRPASEAERRRAREALGLSPEERAVGFVGRLDQAKDPLLALEAFALLSKELPEARLLVVGEGPLREEVEEWVAALGLSRKVRLLGEREARPIMPALDALLLTSAYEGMPYVLLEALTLGVPVVSAPTPGLGPWLKEQGLALVSGRSDPEILAQLLERVLREAPLAEELAERGRAWIQGWGAERMVETIEALYQRVAFQKPPLSPRGPSEPQAKVQG